MNSKPDMVWFISSPFPQFWLVEYLFPIGIVEVWGVALPYSRDKVAGLFLMMPVCMLRCSVVSDPL